MIFEWDEKKNELNKNKHGVSFDEAKTVFQDEYALYFYDEEHSSSEERFIIVGTDINFRELHVCYCVRGKNDDITRIISARKATKQEILLYEENLS